MLLATRAIGRRRFPNPLHSPIFFLLSSFFFHIHFYSTIPPVYNNLPRSRFAIRSPRQFSYYGQRPCASFKATSSHLSFANLDNTGKQFSRWIQVQRIPPPASSPIFPFLFMLYVLHDYIPAISADESFRRNSRRTFSRQFNRQQLSESRHSGSRPFKFLDLATKVPVTSVVNHSRVRKGNAGS